MKKRKDGRYATTITVGYDENGKRQIVVVYGKTKAELELNKAKVIVGFWNKMMRIGTCWIPTPLRLKFIAKRWSKISKDAF